MGRVVDYSQVQEVKDGVGRLPLTQGDMTHVDAEFIRIEPGSSITSTSPGDCDGYWFTLRGQGKVTSDSMTETITSRSFVAVEDGKSVKVANNGTEPLELIHILSPAPGGPKIDGFKGGVSVTNFDDIESVYEEESQKRRFFYLGHKGGYATDRAQGMIVQYAKETVTPKHYHPDAESMFILLDGAVEFTVNGEQKVVGPGNVVYFGMNDIHSSAVANGKDKAEFFEFHLPSAFSIVRI